MIKKLSMGLLLTVPLNYGMEIAQLKEEREAQSKDIVITQDMFLKKAASHRDYLYKLLSEPKTPKESPLFTIYSRAFEKANHEWNTFQAAHEHTYKEMIEWVSDKADYQKLLTIAQKYAPMKSSSQRYTVIVPDIWKLFSRNAHYLVDEFCRHSNSTVFFPSHLTKEHTIMSVPEYTKLLDAENKGMNPEGPAQDELVSGIFFTCYLNTIEERSYTSKHPSIAAPIKYCDTQAAEITQGLVKRLISKLEFLYNTAPDKNHPISASYGYVLDFIKEYGWDDFAYHAEFDSLKYAQIIEHLQGCDDYQQFFSLANELNESYAQDYGNQRYVAIAPDAWQLFKRNALYQMEELFHKKVKRVYFPSHLNSKGEVIPVPEYSKLFREANKNIDVNQQTRDWLISNLLVVSYLDSIIEGALPKGPQE